MNHKDELQKIQNPFRVRLRIAYDGSSFCGWQSQLVYKNLVSLQTVLERALSKIYKEPIHCVAASRTDSGVHAIDQNVHFSVSKDPQTIPLVEALRTLLPPTISAKRAWVVSSDFHANRSAYAKTYRYYVWNDETPSPIHCRFTLWYPRPLNLRRLQSYSKVLIGEHDFQTFQSVGGRPPKSSVRKIYRARWTQPHKNLFVFEITGNGFLRQMIRNLVGTQLRLQEKKEPAEALTRLLSMTNRRMIGRPARPSGLFLSRVHYPRHVISSQQSVELKVYRRS